MPDQGLPATKTKAMNEIPGRDIDNNEAMAGFFRRHSKATNSFAPSPEFLAAGQELARALDSSLAPYVGQLMLTRLGEQREATPEELALIAHRSHDVINEILTELNTFIALDVDAQWSTPLQIVRRFVIPMTLVCRELGLAPLPRDRFLVERFPNDVYNLTPANLATLSEEVGEAALVWGAAKAFEHRARHRSE